MSETTSTESSTPAGTDAVGTDAVPRPIIQLLEQPEASGCCGGGSCGI